MFCEKTCFPVPLKNVRLAAPDSPLPEPPDAIGDRRATSSLEPVGDGAGDQAPSAAASPASQDAGQAAQISRTLASIEESLERLEQTRLECRGEMQQAVVEMAVSIASRLVHQSLEAGAFGVEELVQQMLARFDPLTPVKIQLHPDDLEILRQQMEQTGPSWKGRDPPEFIADKSIGRGNCRIDSDEVGLLSKIDLQLSEIRQHLLECLDDPQLERRGTQAENRLLRHLPDRRRGA